MPNIDRRALERRVADVIAQNAGRAPAGIAEVVVDELMEARVMSDHHLRRLAVLRDEATEFGAVPTDERAVRFRREVERAMAVRFRGRA